MAGKSTTKILDMLRAKVPDAPTTDGGGTDDEDEEEKKKKRKKASDDAPPPDGEVTEPVLIN